MHVEEKEKGREARDEAQKLRDEERQNVPLKVKVKRNETIARRITREDKRKKGHRDTPHYTTSSAEQSRMDVDADGEERD